MENYEYLISVIVPIYNVEEYLSRCIESIINQTYGNLQIILVDDGSTDGSGNICDMYARKDERIQVIHKTNGGVVSARNAGLESALGSYIGFVDGDDYIDAEFYEALLEDIVVNDVDFVHTEFIGRGADCNQFDTKKYDLSKENKHCLIKGIFCKESAIRITPSIWSKLFKKEFILKCHAKVPNEQSYGEDLLCLCICLMEAESIYLHKIALYHYIRRKDSLTDVDFAVRVIKLAQLYQAMQILYQEYSEYEYLLPYCKSYMVRQIFHGAMKLGANKGYVPVFCVQNIECLKGKRIVIYGAGRVGQDYYAQLCKYTSIRIVGWVDKNYQSYNFDYAEVQPIEQLQKSQYDVILVAIKDKELAMQIREDLMKKWKVAEEKILWQCPNLYINECKI